MQIFYTVRPGDTISQIARRWNIPVASMIAVNQLTPPYTIFIGQQLSMPPRVDVYRVQGGDSVYRIAQQYRVSPNIIISANQLPPPYTLQIDQLLKVPPGPPYYVVQPGDTLYQIARRFNVTTGNQPNVEIIRQINQLPNYTIFVGQRLFIPYAPPGEEGAIAYFSNRSGTYDLWAYHLINGTNEQITNGLGDVFSIPYWSRDARKIAFVGGSAVLFVVDIDSKEIARIDQFEDGFGHFIDWSPDHQSLVYSKPNQIVIYNARTHQARMIERADTTDAQWFPNGDEILFQASDVQGVSQLYRMSLDGNERQITQNSGGRYNHVRLSPDGSHVLYTTPGASISIVHTINLATGADVEIPGGPLGRNYNPEWSPNSELIAYNANAYAELGYFSQIRTVGRRGENDRIQAISNCFATPITWSPDNEKIAYLSGCSAQGEASELWMLDLNDPIPIKLTESGNIVSLDWAPVSNIKKTFTSDVFQIQLQYPSHWQQVTENRFEGFDGFFQVSAIQSEESLEIVCQNEAFHELRPYGSQPRIDHTHIQNQQACLIFPSQDQQPEMRGQTALIVTYPTPIVINDTTYQYFILWADQAHIVEIGNTVRFL